MTPRHQVSRAALQLIKRFEGYRRKAARLADGRWTIGYGHTLTAREGAEVSEADAEALLLYDVRPIAAAVNELTYTPLSQNQFDALVAFAFNVGVDNFRRSSVLRRVNEGALIQAACALEMWRKADFEGERIVVDALVRRRAAEKALFLTPADGWIPAPSPILRPRVDYDVGQALPKNPTELKTSLTGERAEAHRPVTPLATEEENSASRAAADAVSARLSAIMPDAAALGLAEADAGIDLTPPAPAVVPEDGPSNQAVTPEPEPAYYAAAAHPVMTILPEPLFSADDDVAQPAELSVNADPLAEAELVRDPRSEQADAPPNLSRRVIWREAPIDAEASRGPGANAFGRLSPLMLAFLFLAGLAVFAGGVVWALNTKDSGLISWALGLVGIVCVVGSVYVYLERLGGRED